MLRDFTTVFLIDDSSSMVGERWDTAKSAVTGVVEVAAKYDEDGVSVYFVNSKRSGREIRSGEEVDDVFGGLIPKGATPYVLVYDLRLTCSTGMRLELILREYMVRLERSVTMSPGGEPETVKPMNLIVVTDGGEYCRRRELADTDTVFSHPISTRLRNLRANRFA